MPAMLPSLERKPLMSLKACQLKCRPPVTFNPKYFLFGVPAKVTLCASPCGLRSKPVAALLRRRCMRRREYACRPAGATSGEPGPAL